VDGNDNLHVKDTIIPRKQWSASDELRHDAADGPLIHCNTTTMIGDYPNEHFVAVNGKKSNPVTVKEKSSD